MAAPFIKTKRKGAAMKKEEVLVFIEKMKRYGDIWEEQDVIARYGDMELEDAIEDRKFDISEFSSLTGMIIDDEE